MRISQQSILMSTLALVLGASMACDKAAPAGEKVSADASPSVAVAPKAKVEAAADKANAADDDDDDDDDDDAARDPVEPAKDPSDADPKADKVEPKKTKSKTKSSKKSDKNAENQVAPLPPSGGVHGDLCSAELRCGPGLACSGLFRNKPGKCVAEAKVKLQCQSEGGEWGKWGRAQATYCMPKRKDAGKQCRDSKDCKGRCLQIEGIKHGQCEKYEVTFGCFREMKDGAPGSMLCAD